MSKLTRRQFIQSVTVTVALPTLPELKIVDEVPTAPEPPGAKVLNVYTVAQVPNRAAIKDPATLAEYCAGMEAHLKERGEMVHEWAAWTEGPDNPPAREMLQNEVYALLDSLAALLVAAEMAGLSEMAGELLTVDDPINYAQCASDPYSCDNSEFRQLMIDGWLWGQEPPAMSEALRRFTIFKSAIGEGAAREL